MRSDLTLSLQYQSINWPMKTYVIEHTEDSDFLIQKLLQTSKTSCEKRGNRDLAFVDVVEQMEQSERERTDK